MEPWHRDLIIALQERVAIIGDENSRQDLVRHTARLQDISEKIERLESQLPATCDPQLRHFLQRRSYGKALDFLENLASPGTP